MAKGTDTAINGHHVGVVADREISEHVIAGLKDSFGVEATFAFVAPSVHSSHMEHLAATADEPRREAEETIEHVVPMFGAAGLDTDRVEVGDPDPVIAIEDLLRELDDVEEIVLVTRPRGEARWAERDAYDRARQRVAIPITHLEVDGAGELVSSERSEGRAEEPHRAVVHGDGNLPDFRVRDLVAIVVAIVGTIVLGVIAARDISVAADATNGTSLGAGSLITALLACGFFLINVWQIVGLTFFESVGYYGAGSAILARISLYGTLGAIVVALILS